MTTIDDRINECRGILSEDDIEQIRNALIFVDEHECCEPEGLEPTDWNDLD